MTNTEIFGNQAEELWKKIINVLKQRQAKTKKQINK